MGKRDEYIEKTKQRLDELNAEMAKLEAQVNQMAGEAKVRQQKALAALREQSAMVRAKLTSYRDQGEGSWENFKDEVEHVKKAFVHSVNYFRSQL